MTLTRIIVKSSFIALLSASSFAFTINSSSAQSETELLNSYVGDWKGSGKLHRDGNSETVRCKLTITDEDGAKIFYKGRCAVAGANFSINGAMAYFEAKKRFEAVMSSSTSFSGVAIGTRNKNGINFKLSDRNAETGDKFEIASTIELNEQAIGIDFSIKNTTTGRIITASIPFRK